MGCVTALGHVFLFTAKVKDWKCSQHPWHDRSMRRIFFPTVRHQNSHVRGGQVGVGPSHRTQMRNSPPGNSVRGTATAQGTDRGAHAPPTTNARSGPGRGTSRAHCSHELFLYASLLPSALRVLHVLTFLVPLANPCSTLTGL